MAGPKSSSSTAKHTPSNTKPAPSSPSSFALQSLWTAYLDSTPSRLKFIDAFLVFLILSGVTQFIYCVLVTSFPFNAFLAGYEYHICNTFAVTAYIEIMDRFASTVGQFVLTASLRSQVNSTNRTLFKDVSPERSVFIQACQGGVLTHSAGRLQILS